MIIGGRIQTDLSGQNALLCVPRRKAQSIEARKTVDER